MASVKIEDLVDHLEREFGRSLEDTFQHFAPNVTVNRGEIYRFFLRRIDHHCQTWEQVPDNLIDT